MEEVASEQLLMWCGIYLCIYVPSQWTVRSLTHVFVVRGHYLFDSSQHLRGLGTVTGSPFTDKEKALQG